MNLKEICQTLSREIQKLVPYDRAAINILQRDEKFFSVYAEESRLPASAIPEGVSVREGTATSWVLDHKEPLICRDVLKDPRFPLTHKRYKNVGLRSYVIIPLVVEGKALGALNLGSLRPRRYGKKEIAILSPVAEILSLAIENSNLYEEAQKREEAQRLLKELSQDITSLDVDSLLQKLTEKVREVLRVDVCDVRLREKGVWRSLGASDMELDRLRQASTGTGRGRSRLVMESRRPLPIPDMSQQTEAPTEKTLLQLGLRGYLGVPLLSRGGEVIGILRALTYQPRAFAQEEVELLQLLANDAAIALENSGLLQQLTVKSRELESANRRLNRLVREQSALRELFTQINLLDSGHLLHQLAEQAVALLQVDHIQVRLLDASGTLQTMALAGNGSERFRAQVGQSGSTRSSWVMENRQPLAIRDISQDKIYGPGRLMREMGVKGYLNVPLVARDQKSIGILLATSLKEREFTREEIALARQLAAGAAVAIENARLFEELQKTSEELEETYRAKSEFLNTMAHELRTPLNVLIATLQLFAEGFYGELDERQKKGMEPMQRNTINLLNLINGILDLARLEAKRVPLQIEDFALKDITDDLHSSFVPLATEKGLELQFKIDAPGLRLKSDKTKLRTIMQNLLGNAIKYSNGGKIELRIGALPRRSADGSGPEAIAIEVEDKGIGIKESDLPHIFEAFYMAEGVNRRKYPGSGLGLSIVKRLAELLHGEIRAQSEWGKGSIFRVTLPVVHPTAA